jgi:DNA recombination protein RmuC
MILIPLILAISALISIFLLYKYVINKSKINFLQILLDEKNKTLQDLTIKYEDAINEKIENIKYIEQISAKVQQQEKLISDFENITKKSQELTKAALFELGNDLSKQLIELHKTETEGNRKLSEENIKITAEKFNSEFERIVNMVGSLKRDIERNYRQNQWANFRDGDEHAGYYHSKRDVYNAILGGLVARDELDAQVFMRDHFEIIYIGG